MANDILKALATLAESGIKLTKEQTAALEEFKATAMREAAEKVFERKLSADALNSAGGWTEEMFDLANSVSSEIVGENVGRGRGEVHEKMFRIETPAGSLKVSLTTPVE